MIGGDERGQQCWEALAILTAMRIWKVFWANERFVLTIKSDRVTALTLATKMKAKGCGLAIITSELALLMSETTFEPDLSQRTPGICNVVADALSRKYDPAWSQNWQLPRCLAATTECAAPCRDEPWWASLSPPLLSR